jgi:hypothetical protein
MPKALMKLSIRKFKNFMASLDAPVSTLGATFTSSRAPRPIGWTNYRVEGGKLRVVWTISASGA